MKKEIKILSKIQESKQTKMIPKFFKTESNDYYNAFSLENSLKPIKTFVKHEDLLVYSHISEDFITVEAECDYRISFYFHPEVHFYQDKREMIREIMEFQWEAKRLKEETKQALIQCSVPFK